MPPRGLHRKGACNLPQASLITELFPVEVATRGLRTIKFAFSQSMTRIMRKVERQTLKLMRLTPLLFGEICVRATEVLR